MQGQLLYHIPRLSPQLFFLHTLYCSIRDAISSLRKSEAHLSVAAVHCLYPLAEYKKLHSIITLSGFQTTQTLKRCLLTYEVSEVRPHAPKVSRAPQTNDPHQRPLTKSKWYEWVKNHKIIFCDFCMFGYMMFEFSWTLQRVPITRRRRLDYVPSWLEHFFNYVERQMEEKVDNQDSLGRESPIMQGPASIFNNLLRVSGLDDREWNFASSSLQVSKRYNIAFVFSTCTKISDM